MDSRHQIGSPLYLLERSDVGGVQLDHELKVTALNSFARRALPVEDKQPFEKMVRSFHPEHSQAKMKFLFDQAECPVGTPPPMTTFNNIPERVVLIKVTKLSDLRGDRRGDTNGYTLIFHAITDVVSSEVRAARRRQGQAAWQTLCAGGVAQQRAVLARTPGHHSGRRHSPSVAPIRVFTSRASGCQTPCPPANCSCQHSRSSCAASARRWQGD